MISPRVMCERYKSELHEQDIRKGSWDTFPVQQTKLVA